MKIKHNNTENTNTSWKIHNQQKAEKNTQKTWRKKTKTQKTQTKLKRRKK